MLRLYNTLTRRVEEFHPLEPGRVRIYSCGPTVYRYVHIGNLRTFLLADWLRRTLEAQGYQVLHVKNITDVGHMRQDVVDRGEDKVIAAALKEGKTPLEITQFYTQAFFQDEAKLRILPAHVFPRATEHIPEMIAIIQRLWERGYAYEAGGNIYFDTARFPGYGRLSRNEAQGLLEGVRVEADPLKRDQRDFALWKAAEPGRLMKWPSPWGEGFPGWHIECSAMSTKYLGEQFDLHTGGVDNIFPHHEDEIAQSEAAFGKPFVGCWVHGQHLLADGLKMAKSTGNSYTLADLEARGFEPLALRYLCLSAHYRTRLNFTFTALRAAQHGLRRLRNLIRGWASHAAPATDLGRPADQGPAQEWRTRFWQALNDDLHLPGACAVLWQMAQAALEPSRKLALVLEFDRILGLGLEAEVAEHHPLSRELQPLVQERQHLRERHDYPPADALRQRLRGAGFQVQDTRLGTRVLWAEPVALPDKLVGTISSAKDVPSLLHLPHRVEFSLNILAHNYLGDVRRCLESLLRWCGRHSIEILAVDNGSDDGSGEWLEQLESQEPRLRVIHTDHPLGEAEGRNIGLRQSLGTYLLFLDTSVEVTGDILTLLKATLADPTVAVTGGWGVCTQDLRTFSECPGPEVDAIQGYCFALKRSLLREVGLMDEKFRFYRNLDLDYSFAFRARGYRLVVTPNLPLRLHEHRVWTTMDQDEIEKRSKRNFYRFLKKWGDRYDLLVGRTASLPHTHPSDQR